MEKVFQRYQEYQITLSISQQQQIGTEVQFASHIVSDLGTRLDAVKIEAIKNFPEPQTITDICSFLG